MHSFSIVVPIYNEEKNITKLIDEIYAQNFSMYKFEVLVVDDCSTDNTLDILRAINKKNFSFIINNKNFGQSFSIHKGINAALYDTIITIDGDGQNDPSDISKLIDHFFSQSDIQLIGGIRTKRKDTKIKIISSKIANYIRSRILKDGCVDTGCSLKIFNKKIFLSFPYFNGIHRFLPALFKGFGHKTLFVSVNHRNRRFGKSKYGTFGRLYGGVRDIIKVRKILNQRYE